MSMKVFTKTQRCVPGRNKVQSCVCMCKCVCVWQIDSVFSIHITSQICSLAVFHYEIECRRLVRETETEPKIGVNLNNLVCMISFVFQREMQVFQCVRCPCASLCVYRFPKLWEICELVHCHHARDKSGTCQRFSSNKHTDGLQRVSMYLLTDHAARAPFFFSSGVSGSQVHAQTP